MTKKKKKWARELPVEKTRSDCYFEDETNGNGGVVKRVTNELEEVESTLERGRGRRESRWWTAGELDIRLVVLLLGTGGACLAGDGN